MASVRKYIDGAAVLVAGLCLVGFTAPGVQAQDAKQLYMKDCNMCHGPNGKGDGPAGKMLKPPPADFAAVLKGQADADITKIIKEGGKSVGKSTAMPAFGKRLKDDQIQSLVKYIKGFAAAK